MSEGELPEKEPIKSIWRYGYQISYRHLCSNPACQRPLPVDFTWERLKPTHGLCGLCWTNRKDVAADKLVSDE